LPYIKLQSKTWFCRVRSELNY